MPVQQKKSWTNPTMNWVELNAVSMNALSMVPQPMVYGNSTRKHDVQDEENDSERCFHGNHVCDVFLQMKTKDYPESHILIIILS